MDFDEMIQEAQAVLEKSEIDDLVATSLLTDKGNIYVVHCNVYSHCCHKTDSDYSLNDLIENGDTRILKMITMFKLKRRDEIVIAVDIPCVVLCRAIYNMNHDNIEAEVKFNSGAIRTYLKEPTLRILD